MNGVWHCIAETLPNARAGDEISFFASGNLSRLGRGRVLHTRRASWAHDSALVQSAQRVMDVEYNVKPSAPFVPRTVGLDAGVNCRVFGCAPRVWFVEFASDLPGLAMGNGTAIYVD
eukprot:COSAG05_NODE_2607_length_2846_cov_13.463497_2_plen_117_part_00